MTRTTCRLLHEHEAQKPDHRNRVAARVEERRNAPTWYVLSAAMYQRLIDAVKCGKVVHVHVELRPGTYLQGPIIQ